MGYKEAQIPKYPSKIKKQKTKSRKKLMDIHWVYIKRINKYYRHLYEENIGRIANWANSSYNKCPSFCSRLISGPDLFLV